MFKKLASREFLGCLGTWIHLFIPNYWKVVGEGVDEIAEKTDW